VNDGPALELAGRALQAAEGDEALALVHKERSGMARFAGSAVHQPTLIENEVIELQVARDGRLGVASGNRTDEKGLRALAERAAEAAKSAPADPDFPGLAQPAELPGVEGYDEETASLAAEEQAGLAAAAIAASDLDLYGFFTSGSTELALASTTGLRASQPMTDVAVLTLAAVDGASGYAERTSWRRGEVDPGAAAGEAAEKAKHTRGAVELEPGSYHAVLEPYAFAELLLYFAYDAFGALGLLEERSYAHGRIGQKVFDERLSIADDALDPRGLPKAFDFEGSPKQRVQLIEQGVLRGVVWDRATAKRADGGQQTTGHAPPSGARQWGPLPLALSVAGGEAESTEELAELLGDGIYITRLHYLGIVNPREGVVTGMTRDGTFRIRGGKIADPLVNLRFTVTVPEFLAELPGLTREPVLVNQSAYYDERYPTGILVPGVATARFDVTGVGSGPGV
jgi:predicted Zn-dependent protease